MGLFGKKKNVEGWSETQTDPGRLTALKESFQNSSRAWLASMIGVVLIGLCMILITAKNEQVQRVTVPEPPHREHGIYDDKAHRQFITEFNAVMRRRGIQTQFQFINSGRVKIVVAEDTSADDIVFLSSWAARAVNKRFHTAPWVYTYTRDSAVPPNEKQVALTQWVSRNSDFVVTLTPATGVKQPDQPR